MLEISNISNLYEIINNIDYRVIYEITKEIDYTTVMATFSGIHIAFAAFVYPYIYSSNINMKLNTPSLYRKLNKNIIFKQYFIIEIILLFISLLILLLCDNLFWASIALITVVIACCISIYSFYLLNMYNINYEKIRPEYYYPRVKMKEYRNKHLNQVGVDLNDTSVMKSEEVIKNNNELQTWQQIIVKHIHNSSDVTDTVELIESKIIFYLDSYLKDIGNDEVPMDWFLNTRNIFSFVGYVMDRVNYISQEAVNYNQEEVSYLIYGKIFDRYLLDENNIFNKKNNYFKHTLMDYFSVSLCYKILKNKFDIEMDLNALTGAITFYIKKVNISQSDGSYINRFEFIQRIFRNFIYYNPSIFKKTLSF